MIWISRIRYDKILDTHYYIGLDSICGAAKIGDGIHTYKSYQFGATKCKLCRTIYKSSRITRKAELYQQVIIDIQERLEQELLTSLEHMIITHITFDNNQKTTLDKLYETFAKECTSQILACMLTQMILDDKITIQDNVVKLSLEVQH